VIDEYKGAPLPFLSLRWGMKLFLYTHLIYNFAGGLLPGMVVPVVDLFAVGTESADALALVLTMLLFLVSEGIILIGVGDTDDLCRLFVGIFHRYNHAYV